MQNIVDICNMNVYYEYKRRCQMKNLKMKFARMEKDLSQIELAKRVGVTRQTIGMIESGFTLRCLQRLSLPNLATLPCTW